MKRKPDVIVTLIVVFCLGMLVTGLASLERGPERTAMRVTMLETPSSDFTATR